MPPTSSTKDSATQRAISPYGGPSARKYPSSWDRRLRRWKPLKTSLRHGIRNWYSRSVRELRGRRTWRWSICASMPVNKAYRSRRCTQLRGI